MNITLCDSSQAQAVEAFFDAVFTDSEDATEGRIVGRLAFDLLTQTEPEDLFAIAAWEEEDLVGCIIFSRMRFELELPAFLMAPVGVHSEHQRKGVGQGLIRHGLTELAKRGIQLVLTYGDPKYYGKTGFRQVTAHEIPPPFELSQPIGWLAQRLDGQRIRPIEGRSTCVAAMHKQEYW
ncbi:MAG: N-acetyltransferase [bacterium]|nr:N-acetyltransferase [bacterium]